MLLTSVLYNSKYLRQENYPKEVSKICLLSFKNILIERFLMSLGMEFQIFAPEYLIDCCVIFAL